MEPSAAPIPRPQRARVLARCRRGGVHLRGDRSARERRQLHRRARRRGADRGAQRRAPPRARGAPPAVHAGARLRARARARRADAAARLAHQHEDDQGRLVRLGTARVGPDLGVDARARGDLRRQRRRHVLAEGDPADRAPSGRDGQHRRPRNPLPRDRRPGQARAPAGDPRRQRAADGELARARHAPPRRVGDGPQLADGRESGRDPAGLQRGHPRFPLGREGHLEGDDLFLARRLRRDRAAARRTAAGC